MNITVEKLTDCGHEQGDMGHSVACEECGGGPLPTHEDVVGFECEGGEAVPIEDDSECDDYAALRAERDALKAENTRLREALKDIGQMPYCDAHMCGRAARKALEVPNE